MSIGSYWSLLAGIVPSSRLAPYLSHLSNKNEFNRLHRVPSLSASTPGYEADGGYWKGGVWAPAVYMILRGLTNVEQDSLAYEIACNHLHNVVEVYHKTGTFFENYAPDMVRGNDRKILLMDGIASPFPNYWNIYSEYERMYLIITLYGIFA